VGPAVGENAGTEMCDECRGGDAVGCDEGCEVAEKDGLVMTFCRCWIVVSL
jgi:hypothetical protein